MDNVVFVGDDSPRGGAGLRVVPKRDKHEGYLYKNMDSLGGLIRRKEELSAFSQIIVFIFSNKLSVVC